jgi:hypothetical protein
MFTIIGRHTQQDSALLNAVVEHGPHEVRDAATQGGRVNLWVRQTSSSPRERGQLNEHEDMSLLVLAIRLQKPEVVRDLLLLGLDPYMDPPEEDRAQEGSDTQELLGGLKRLLMKPNNPLRLVIKQGNTVMLQALLAGGIDPDGPDESNLVAAGKKWAVQYPLLDVLWYSPPDRAAQAVALLLNHGADDTRVDVDGRTVWDTAQQIMANSNFWSSARLATARAMQPALEALADQTALQRVGEKKKNNSGGCNTSTDELDAKAAGVHTLDRDVAIPGAGQPQGRTTRRRVL